MVFINLTFFQISIKDVFQIGKAYYFDKNPVKIK